MKILVRNLATATTEEKLLSLFSEYGKVQSCTLVLDKATGKSKGFGFVEMPKVGEAKVAIQKLNGYKLAGNIIRVKKDEAKKENTEVVAETADKTNAIKSAAKKEVKAATVNSAEESTEVKNNENNALNIYGKIKQSDDKF